MRFKTLHGRITNSSSCLINCKEIKMQIQNASSKDYKTNAIDYLYNKAKTDLSKSELSLNLLLNNGVGIGDHSTGDFYTNLDEAIDMLIDSTDRLDILAKYYPRGKDVQVD